MTPTRLMAWALAVTVTVVLATVGGTYAVVGVMNAWPDGDPPYANSDPRLGRTTTDPIRYCAGGSLMVYDATQGWNGHWLRFDDAPECEPIPACESDDGSGPRPCRWDATKQGDGKGTSFTVTADGSVAMDR